VVLASGLR
jgi:hypothetical protein